MNSIKDPTMQYYCVIEFAYREANLKNPFAVVPRSWLATFCGFHENGPALVKYPEQKKRVTDEQVKHYDDYSNDWKTYFAYVHDCMTELADAKAILGIRIRSRKKYGAKLAIAQKRDKEKYYDSLDEGRKRTQDSFAALTKTRQEKIITRKEKNNSSSMRKRKGNADSSDFIGENKKRNRRRHGSTVISTRKVAQGDDSSRSSAEQRKADATDNRNDRTSATLTDEREKDTTASIEGATQLQSDTPNKNRAIIRDDKDFPVKTRRETRESTSYKTDNEKIIHPHVVIRLDKYSTNYVYKPITLSKETYDRLTTLARNIVRDMLTKN